MTYLEHVLRAMPQLSAAELRVALVVAAEIERTRSAYITLTQHEIVRRSGASMRSVRDAVQGPVFIRKTDAYRHRYSINRKVLEERCSNPAPSEQPATAAASSPQQPATVAASTPEQPATAAASTPKQPADVAASEEGIPLITTIIKKTTTGAQTSQPENASDTADEPAQPVEENAVVVFGKKVFKTLLHENVKRDVAEQLIEEHGVEAVAVQLRHLRYLQRSDRKTPVSPSAWLVAAIRHGYAVPSEAENLAWPHVLDPQQPTPREGGGDAQGAGGIQTPAGEGSREVASEVPDWRGFIEEGEAKRKEREQQRSKRPAWATIEPSQPNHEDTS